MTTPISALAQVTWINTADGLPLPAATLNSGFNTINALGNSVIGCLTDLQACYASLAASPPTDKPAGKIWFNTDTQQWVGYPTLGGTPVPFASGAVANNYISGSGTGGTDNTAQTVKSIVLAANSLSAATPRIKISAFVALSGAGPVNALVSLNGTSVGGSFSITGSHGAWLELFLSYVDATHVNVSGAFGDEGLSVVSATPQANRAGFSHTGAQTIILAQAAVVASHLVVFELCAERVLP